MARYKVLSIWDGHTKEETLRYLRKLQSETGRTDLAIFRILNEQEEKEFAWEMYKRFYKYFEGKKLPKKKEPIHREMFGQLWKEWKEKENG